MAEPKRISPERARERVQSGAALLVCAYDNEERCRRMLLEGAITLGELEARLPSLSPDQEIIFYCG